jgi:DNA (cytosine-5)-methyltransferase 1
MSPYRFTHGSLFSGIGGFDLAAEWMGWDNIFHCEWNAFGQKVLKHYWPNAISYEDITKTDFTIHRGRIDILTGGFPCQPYSSAGKRLGKEDDRHLWPEMLRAIREIQPMYVVGENVRGLTNWNGGMVFDEVQADLENQGYEVLPFLLPACAVNAPHRRDRIWFVANTTSNGHDAKPKEGNNKVGENNQQSRAQRKRTSEGFSNERDASNTNSNGLNECNSNNEINPSKGGKYALGDINQSNGNGDTTDSNCSNSQAWSQRKVLGQSDRQKANGHCNVERTNQWQNFPTVSPICIGDDGLSDRLDSITFPKWRNESIKAGGNAIVPQVAYQIFKALCL